MTKSIRVPRVYVCKCCEMRREKYRAIDDVPKFGHLCEECSRAQLDEIVTEHYVEVHETGRT
jgi:hypothetical protein